MFSYFLDVVKVTIGGADEKYDAAVDMEEDSEM
jgi:hypothetical protein